MRIERWDPSSEMVSLRDAMNFLFQESFVQPSGARPERGAATCTLPLDVTEGENDFVVTASLPGIKPEDVQTTVLGDTLTIRGESKADGGAEGPELARARAACRLIPAFRKPGHAHQCRQGQRSVRARCPDSNLAEVGAGPSQADQAQCPLASSQPERTPPRLSRVRASGRVPGRGRSGQALAFPDRKRIMSR